MRYTAHRAFTLIEMIIVLAVMALLTKLAVGLYQTHVIKARVNTAIHSFQPYLLQATQYYSDNTTLGCSMMGWSANTWNTVSQNSVYQVQYAINATNKSIWFMFNLDPSINLPAGEPNYMMMGMQFDATGNGVIYCGHPTTAVDATYLNFKYLPNACQTTNLTTLFGTADGC